MEFCICVSTNEDFKVGDVLKLIKQEGNQYHLEKEDGSIVLYSKWKFERDFHYTNIFWIPTYDKIWKLTYFFEKIKFWDREYFKEDYYRVGGKCYYRDREYYDTEYNSKIFSQDREQYALLEKALWRLAKVRDFNENLVFQVSDTLKASLDALLVYFEKLEDDLLTEEVMRFNSLVDELVTLHEEVDAKVDNTIENQWTNALQQSVNQHKEMLNVTIETLKKINTTR